MYTQNIIKQRYLAQGCSSKEGLPQTLTHPSYIPENIVDLWSKYNFYSRETKRSSLVWMQSDESECTFSQSA